TLRGAEPVVLRGRYLSLDVVLRRCADPSQWLAVRADPWHGRLGEGAVPELDVAGPWAARVALMSRVTLFWPTPGVGAPAAGWRALAAEELMAEWREPRPRDWFWRCLLRLA